MYLMLCTLRYVLIGYVSSLLFTIYFEIWYPDDEEVVWFTSVTNVISNDRTWQRKPQISISSSHQVWCHSFVEYICFAAKKKESGMRVRMRL